MRVGSALPKMESKSMGHKLPAKGGASHDVEAATAYFESAASVSSAPNVAQRGGRVTGKRSSRDEPVEKYGSPAAPSTPHGLDLTSVSSLCHELLERKRMMLSQVASATSANDAEHHGVKASDDDSDSGMKMKLAGQVKEEPLTEEDIQKRKAQRRREQVRAASRRCRDRQRRETEELRMKVFQLEEFISHTFQTYEGELRRQRQQLEMVQQENDTLRARLAVAERSTSSVASSPASVGSVSMSSHAQYAIKQEPVVDPRTPGLVDEGNQVMWDPARIQNMHATVEDCKRAMISIMKSTAAPEIQRQAFGWNFDFWSHNTQYFVKTRKFFPRVRARELADRNFNVDYVKYIETFPEVKEKKILHQLSDNVKIVQIVKDMPGKGLVSSLSASFLSRDDHFERPTGERWVVGVISVGSSLNLQFGHEDECNGYVFEDAMCVLNDGREVHGCLVQGTGRYEGRGKNLPVLMEELAKIFASVVIRWEGLFINDFMEEDGDDAVAEIDELDF